MLYAINIQGICHISTLFIEYYTILVHILVQNLANGLNLHDHDISQKYIIEVKYARTVSIWFPEATARLLDKDK